MTRETLDETLDRVANAITAVPPDPTFAERLRPALAGPAGPPVGWRASLVVACVLLLAVTAGLVRHRDSGIRRAAVEKPYAVAQPEALQAERATSAEVVRAADRDERSTASARASAVRVETGGGIGESAIPALSPPPNIAFAHLQLDPLVVDPVDLARIELTDISVTTLGVSEEPKE